MKTFGEEKPPLAQLAHHGVKGMRWGVRKNKVTGAEIRGARSRQRQREDVATNPSVSAKKRAQAARDFNTNEDRVTAMRLTKGEKVATVILGGPLGLVFLTANHLGVARSARKTDAARAAVK